MQSISFCIKGFILSLYFDKSIFFNLFSTFSDKSILYKSKLLSDDKHCLTIVGFSSSKTCNKLSIILFILLSLSHLDNLQIILNPRILIYDFSLNNIFLISSKYLYNNLDSSMLL